MPEYRPVVRPVPRTCLPAVCFESVVKTTAIHIFDVYQRCNPKAIEKRVAIS
jgi:hypothetical protein